MMEKKRRIIKDQTIFCLQYASVLARNYNKRTVGGDELFWGIYAFMRNTDLFEIFCSVMWFIDHQALHTYFLEKYETDFAKIQFSPWKHLPPNKKIKLELDKIKQWQYPKIDIMGIFFVSYSDLSSECENYLLDSWMELSSLIENCSSLMIHPMVMKVWLFAFLEILHKILVKFGLPFNKIQLMTKKQIDDLDIMSHLEDLEQIVDDEQEFVKNYISTPLNYKDNKDFDWIVNKIDSDVKEREHNDGDKSENKNKSDKKQKEVKKMTVEYFGIDLTKECKDGFVDPIIWRSEEIQQLIYTLLRKNKNNPLLIWEAWVGKTAIVEWLAQKIALWDVPSKLKKKRIFMLDMWSLVAGTKYRWEFEARMKSILEEATDPLNNIILFIDELHTIIWAGGHDTNDAAQMIKPLLARGKIKLIGATTFDEYQKYIEKDAALKRRFQEIIVNEPDESTTEQILLWLKESYENYHGVQIGLEAIQASVNLSKRYILNKYFPDKALDIIDEACARKSTMIEKLENDVDFKKDEKRIEKIQKKIDTAIEQQDYFTAAELKEWIEKIKQDMKKIRNVKNIPLHLRPTITIADIGQVLSDKVGVPANIVNESEINKLRRLDSELSEKILWQKDVVKSVVSAITKSRLSAVVKDKPIWSFLFLGPSWVGKTYLAKLLAKEYFGDEKSLIRIDMSEFMEKYSISKLIWSPAWYVGYEEWWNLTEAVRRKPYSVVLFDEVEKASPEVLNILLQILDEWVLKDSKWRLVDFKSTIIIMTSNIWAEEFSKKKVSIGFNVAEQKDYEKNEFKIVEERVKEEIKTFMLPELLNRLDKILVFNPLDKEVLTDILKKELNCFLWKWKDSSSVVLPKFSDKKLKWIIDKIFDPQYGARPVLRYIHDEIESEIIDGIIKKS